MSTNSVADQRAKDCIDRLLSESTDVEFGYKMQALAAHVLLRLGYRIKEVNQFGHPDITAFRDGSEYRFEIEAQVGNPRPRQLEAADIESLTEVPDDFGYYALAISFPKPYWVVVPVHKLADRKRPSSNVLLESLSDKNFSAEWNAEYQDMLSASCRRIEIASFTRLSELAVSGSGL